MQNITTKPQAVNTKPQPQVPSSTVCNNCHGTRQVVVKSQGSEEIKVACPVCSR